MNVKITIRDSKLAEDPEVIEWVAHVEKLLSRALYKRLQNDYIEDLEAYVRGETDVPPDFTKLFKK